MTGRATTHQAKIVATNRTNRIPSHGLRSILTVLATLCLLLNTARGMTMLDITSAVVVTPPNLSGREQKAVQLLLEEVGKRTGLLWTHQHSWPEGPGPIIAVAPASALKTFLPQAASNLDVGDRPRPAEGYRLRILKESGRDLILVAGNDARGVLFGIGRLLRTLRMETGQVMVPAELNLDSAPRYPLRGHQLGYRPKTNSYDGWDVPTWEQYFRDLAVFGANAIELIPPRSDDDATSPLFPLPPMEMMQHMSRLADNYGLDVWIWYPAMDKDYSDPKTVQLALEEWSEVFWKLPRIDAVFVPGGDPGHTQPKHLMALLEKQTQALHRYHPRAQMWVSPQSFSQEWLDEFLGILREDKPAWLTGVVYGPQVRITLAQLRAAVPTRYPIRHYPDITHSVRCQFPVPDWDRAYAFTEGREGINPRPVSQASIFSLFEPMTIGFLSYSEGCNDDVNKAIWSALGWDPATPIIEILRDYSRYFIGARYSDDFAQGLLALERNWQGPLLVNTGVDRTLEQFLAMEKSASTADLKNWRFQQALYRAYYDAYTRRRLIYESGLEERAMEKLRDAAKLGSQEAMRAAEEGLNRAETDRVYPAWRARVFELAEALFQSIRMQLSVERYHAEAVDRGANLDSIDVPLNNRAWLEEKIAEVRRLPEENERLKAIDAIVNWCDPGPGGFYDDLGNPTCQPHLMRGSVGDPAGYESAAAGFTRKEFGRVSWWDHAESLYDAPLKLRYDGLDPSAAYKLRVIYGGNHPGKKIQLVANGTIQIHPLREKLKSFEPLEFDLPAEATTGGTLTLIWTREPGLGDDGRGCQVAEVWLMKKQIQPRPAELGPNGHEN